jgi:hypothetical protein
LCLDKFYKYLLEAEELIRMQEALMVVPMVEFVLLVIQIMAEAEVGLLIFVLLHIHLQIDKLLVEVVEEPAEIEFLVAHLVVVEVVEVVGMVVEAVALMVDHLDLVDHKLLVD